MIINIWTHYFGHITAPANPVSITGTVDMCQNETCSSKGSCKSNMTSKYCMCYEGYFGDHCEYETEKTKRTEAIISAASILAIIIISVFYLLFILMDLSRCRGSRTIRSNRFLSRRHLRLRDLERKQSDACIPQRLVYYNF